MRQKRQEVIEDMQTQVAQLQRQNAALLGRLNMAEQERRSMHRKLTCARCTHTCTQSRPTLGIKATEDVYTGCCG